VGVVKDFPTGLPSPPNETPLPAFSSSLHSLFEEQESPLHSSTSPPRSLS